MDVWQSLSKSRFLERSPDSLAMVYGHRRVGKSELLRQAIRGSGLPYVFFKCHQTSESQNLSTFRFGFIARCGYDGVKSTENHSLHTLADLYDPENFD